MLRARERRKKSAPNKMKDSPGSGLVGGGGEFPSFSARKRAKSAEEGGKIKRRERAKDSLNPFIGGT